MIQSLWKKKEDKDDWQNIAQHNWKSTSPFIKWRLYVGKVQDIDITRLIKSVSSSELSFFSGFLQRLQIFCSPGRLKMILQSTLAISFVSSPFPSIYFIEVSKRIEVFFWIPIQLGCDFKSLFKENGEPFLLPKL